MIRKVAVIGGGLMGRQIALNTAIYPYEAYVYDLNAGVRAAVKQWEDEYLAGRIKKGRMTEEQVAGIRERFHIAETIEEAVSDADLIIEAVVEQKEVKKAVFRQLSALAREDAILATNSSYMVSSTFKDDVTNPSRLVNVHYFNPALVMKLVEVCRGEHTSDETVEACVAFARSTGKTPVRIEKEIDGFLANRILTEAYSADPQGPAVTAAFCGVILDTIRGELKQLLNRLYKDNFFETPFNFRPLVALCVCEFI